MEEVKVGKEDFRIQSFFSGFNKVTTPWVLRKAYLHIILDTFWVSRISSGSVKQPTQQSYLEQVKPAKDGKTGIEGTGENTNWSLVKASRTFLPPT